MHLLSKKVVTTVRNVYLKNVIDNIGQGEAILAQVCEII